MNDGLNQNDMHKQANLNIFFEAYRFFSKNSASIEIINENNELQEVHFGYLPHFNALNDVKIFIIY